MAVMYMEEVQLLFLTTTVTLRLRGEDAIYYIDINIKHKGATAVG